MKTKPARNDNEDDIDITPMLDVVFIMLIFFIVTASFVKENGIGLYSPPISEASEPAPAPVEIRVTDTDQILLQGREINSRALRATIVRLRAENPDMALTIVVEPAAKTRFIVQAMDGVRAANIALPSITLAKS